MVCLPDTRSNSQNFFPFGNPPYAKKSKRESLYFDQFPGPFESADFLKFVYSIKGINNTKVEIKSFICLQVFITYNNLCLQQYKSRSQINSNR